jgi:hypothetical protein
MELHKPKPWHGVREFLKEYVIIVVGVLTALGAEQAVEWLHWQHEVDAADTALRKELHLNGTFAYEAVAAWPCEQRRLDELSADLRHATGTWKAQWFITRNGRKTAFVAPGHPYPVTTWEEYKANGAVQHMSDERRWLLNSAFVDVEAEGRWGEQQGQAGAELAILADDLPLSDVTRDRELAAIERERLAGGLAAQVGLQLVGLLGQLGLSFTEAEKHPTVAACTARFTGADAAAR